jgi:hypothetical protein
MKIMPVTLPYYACGLCLCAALVLTIIACGCTQQQAPPSQIATGVMVTKPDASHISVAYEGGPGMENVTELNITVTDSNGRSMTVPIGNHLNTTLVRIRATQTFTGAYSGKDHVFITGYFANGSQLVVFDQDI